MEKYEADGEVDRLRDVCDEDRLLSVIDEEAQCAGGRVEVSLQHHCRYFVIVIVPFMSFREVELKVRDFDSRRILFSSHTSYRTLTWLDRLSILLPCLKLFFSYASLFARSRTEEDEYLQETPVELYTGFEDMNLKDEVLRGVYSYGFEKPSLIQQKGIVPIIRGRDLIAQAQSGTGKTATFSIACLQKVDVTIPYTQALILSPTRELAIQSFNVWLLSLLFLVVTYFMFVPFALGHHKDGKIFTEFEYLSCCWWRLDSRSNIQGSRCSTTHLCRSSRSCSAHD
jgi:hypothetical protein